MKIQFKLFFTLLCFILICACHSPKKVTTYPAAKSDYSWDKNDKMVALLHEGKIIWKLNFDKEQDKPYFHPLKTPNGYELTLERPKDHPWHRGLWFSWKYINGINYWEEKPEKGVSEGRSIINSVNISILSGGIKHLMFKRMHGYIWKNLRSTEVWGGVGMQAFHSGPLTR